MNLSKLTSEQLTNQFVAIAVKMGDAMSTWDTPSFNRLYAQMMEVQRELKGRPGDQRALLLALLDHSDISVRLQAATATLAIARQTARDVLATIASSGDMPFAGEAASRIENLDSGLFKPT